MSDAETVLRNLLDACDRGRPLSDIADRLRVEVGRLDGRRVCDACIGRSDGEAVVCVHMVDQPNHLRTLAIDAGRAALAHWEMIGEPELTQLVTQVLDAADEVLSRVADGPTAAPTRPTREQVREAIERHVCGVGWDVEGVDGVDEATDAVMALLAGEGTGQPAPSDDLGSPYWTTEQALAKTRASGEGTAPQPEADRG